MRFIVSCTAVLFLFVSHLAAQPALEQRLTVSLSDKTLADLLMFIEKETKLSFMYEDKLINVDSKISINEVNQTLHHILRKAIPDESIAFTCMGRQVILHKKKEPDAPPPKIQTSQTRATPRYRTVYDTVSLLIFDTVVTQLVDTTVIFVYDTLVSFVEKQLDRRYAFEYLFMPLCELNNTGKANAFDSLNLARGAVSSNLQLLLSVYYPFQNCKLGVGIAFKYRSQKFDYNIAQLVTETSLDTIYYTLNYYEYFLNHRYDVTDFGDSVLVQFLDSMRAEERVPQVMERSETKLNSFTSDGKTEIAYVGLPVSVRFPLMPVGNGSLFLEATAEIYYKIYYKGLRPESTKPVAPDFKTRDFLWSGKASAFYEVPLNKRISFVVNGGFTMGKNAIYRNSNNLLTFGFHIGAGILFE